MFRQLFSSVKLDCLEANYLKQMDTFNKNVLLKIFTNPNYKKLDSELKEQILKAIDSLVHLIGIDFMDKKDILDNFLTLLNQESENPNFKEYIRLFCAYPMFLFRNQFDLKELYQINDPEFIKYLWVEVAFCLEDVNFWVNTEYEKLVRNPKLKELNLTEVVVNGLVNTFLGRAFLIESISLLLLYKEDYSWLILKLFQAPTSKHIELVLKLVNDNEVAESSHIEEMVDMIYAIPLDELNEIEFKITHELIYKEMTFKDACQKYFKQAMELLDESEQMKSTTLVRIPIYRRR